MFCVSFLSHILSALCACFIGLVLSQALGYVAAPLAEPKREHLANELVRQRDEVVQRGVRRADLAAVRETAEGQDLQPRRHDVRAPGTVRVDAVYLGFDPDEVAIVKEIGAPAVVFVRFTLGIDFQFSNVRALSGAARRGPRLASGSGLD